MHGKREEGEEREVGLDGWRGPGVAVIGNLYVPEDIPTIPDRGQIVVPPRHVVEELAGQKTDDCQDHAVDEEDLEREYDALSDRGRPGARALSTEHAYSPSFAPESLAAHFLHSKGSGLKGNPPAWAKPRLLLLARESMAGRIGTDYLSDHVPEGIVA